MQTHTHNKRKRGQEVLSRQSDVLFLVEKYDERRDLSFWIRLSGPVFNEWKMKARELNLHAELGN